MSTYSFYFKVAYTCQTVNYDINLDMSLTEFIEQVTTNARTDFDINSNYNIEIVIAGQSNNVNGRDAEVAPALENSDMTIREKLGDGYKYVAFYIRPVLLSPMNFNQINLENSLVVENSSVVENSLVVENSFNEEINNVTSP